MHLDLNIIMIHMALPLRMSIALHCVMQWLCAHRSVFLTTWVNSQLFNTLSWSYKSVDKGENHAHASAACIISMPTCHQAAKLIKCPYAVIPFLPVMPLQTNSVAFASCSQFMLLNLLPQRVSAQTELSTAVSLVLTLLHLKAPMQQLSGAGHLPAHCVCAHVRRCRCWAEP